MAEWGDEETFMQEMRSPDEVARRCIVLCCVVAHGEDNSQTHEGWLTREGLMQNISPRELAFLRDREPKENELRQASWRSEAFLVLMWALRKIETLPSPIQSSSFAKTLELVPAPGETTTPFVQGATLRSLDEVVEVYEQTFDGHWKVRDARMRGEAIPDGLDPDVLYERHYALNWLRRYGIFEEQSWDEITTDT